MQPQGKGVRKVLVVALICVLVLLLVVLFAKVFFASRSSMSNKTMMGYAAPALGIGNSNPMDIYQEKSMAMQALPSNTMMNGVITDSFPEPGTLTSPMVGERMIKTGMLNLRVKSTDEATQKAYAVAAQMGGAVSNSSFSQYGSNLKSGTMTVRVPVEKFDEAFVVLKKIAVLVQTESTAGSDVTAQVIDLQARINNKKAAEVTMQALFERAVKISDVIEITDKLSVLRGEIESLEGQMRYLNDQTSLSTITLTMSEDTVIESDRGFRPLQTMKESVVALLQSVGRVAELLIAFVIIGLPSLLAYGLILWGIYVVARKMVTKLLSGSVDGHRAVVRKK